MPNSDFKNIHFTWSDAEWYQPSVPGDSGYPKAQWNNEQDNAPDSSFWDGIGDSDLIQAGADSIGTYPPTYEFWYEDYPGGTVWETSPSIAAGQEGSTYIEYNSNGTPSYFLENVTTGGYTPYANESSPYVGYRALDFINEALGAYLPDYGTSTMSYCDGGNGSNTYYLQTNDNNIVYMTSNGTSGGTPMSSPSGVTDSTDSYVNHWEST